MDKIGFGCARLTANFTEKQAISNLEVAFENGVTHFDVARLYGFGLAEGMLGKFTNGKRDKITITTKFGLFPNNSVLKNLFLQNVIRSVFRASKKLLFRKIAQNAANTAISRRLSVADARKSLETSLRELNTEYIDYLLLHEAEIGEANNADLLDFLERQKEKGVIGAYGLGSFSRKLLPGFDTLSDRYTILQTDNSFPERVPEILLKKEQIEQRFYFSPFLNFGKITRLFKEQPLLKAAVIEKLGLSSMTTVIELCLMNQVNSDPTGTLLFASSDNKKIRDTIRNWEKVSSLRKERYVNFEEVRSLISEKLTQSSAM